MFWDKEKIISVYEKEPTIEGDPYVRDPNVFEKDPSTKRIDRETGKIITLEEEKFLYPYKTIRQTTLVLKTNMRALEILLELEDNKDGGPPGFIWNGQNIPTILWSILFIGKHSPEGLRASKWHDYLLYKKMQIFNMIKLQGEKLDIKEYRRLTTLIFRELLITGSGGRIGPMRAGFMAAVVGGWQFVSPQWWGIK